MAPPAIWSHFESLKDPRVERTRRHELMDIVIVSILAVVCNADGWSEIVDYANTKEARLELFRVRWRAAGRSRHARMGGGHLLRKKRSSRAYTPPA
jgi:hypothetical protein